MKIDGVELTDGDRVILRQGDRFWIPWLKYVVLRPWKVRQMIRSRKSRRQAESQNGIYVVTVGTWVRDATDD